MFQKGDRILYGSHGICTVADTEKRIIDRKTVSYLVLEPVSHPGSRYLVPAQNPSALAKLKPMLKAQELEALLDPAAILPDVWIREEGLRKKRYRELLSGGEREQILSMLRQLCRYKQEQEAAGRKWHMCDENFFRDAQKLLCSEIAVVLELSPEQAKQYFLEKLK